MLFGAVTIHQQGLKQYPAKLQTLSVNSKNEKQKNYKNTKKV